MRIALDYQAFCRQTYGGISRYFVRLAEQFLAQRQEVRVFAPLHRCAHLETLPEEIVRGRRLDRYPPKSTPLFMAYNRLAAMPALRNWQPQIVHETYYARGGSAPRSCPVVITVYDMIHEMFPAEFSRLDNTSQRKRIAIERADSVICISDSTRRDLVRLFGTPEKKISVVHLGFERFAYAAPADRPPHSLTGGRPFLLYVGNRGGYKNFAGFLKAFSSSTQLRGDFDVVAFGGGALATKEKELISRLGLREGQVRQMDGSDSTLGQLYDQAIALIYPSLYEGFGLPPLEAMAHRCPVISSNTSSMPEVIGNAGALFDPNSMENMVEAIEGVVYSDDQMERLKALGTARLANFSWQRCAEETLSIYRALLE